MLTVAVSISSAVANLGSTIPFVDKHSVWFAVGIIVLITVLNLRGVKESGAFFAIPVYFFIFSIFVMIGYAIVQMLTGHDLQAESANWTDRRREHLHGRGARSSSWRAPSRPAPRP